MNNSRSKPVEFVAVFLIAFVGSVTLSTGFCWAQKTSWSSSDYGNASQTKSHSRSAFSSDDPTPFSPGSNNLALDLGQIFLMGDGLKQYSDNLGAQLHYTYGVSDLFAFDSSFGYSQHSDGKLSMATVLTGVRLNLSWYDKIIPYGVVGLGFYRPTFQDTTVAPPATLSPGSNSDTPTVSAILFGVHFGSGVDLELSKNLFFGASLTLHKMFGTDKQFANGSLISFSGGYTSFFAHLGVTF